MITDASQGFRVCLSVYGVRCASDAVPLERMLRRLDGVRDATVNALRSRVWIEVDMLARLEPVVQLLGDRGYAVDTSQVQVTTWLPGSRPTDPDLERDLLMIRNVTYCARTPTGRVEVGFTFGPGWPGDLKRACLRLCQAAAALGLRGRDSGPKEDS